MGAFNETRIDVASTSVPLFDLDVEPIKESVIRSLFRNENIVDNLIEDAINNIGGTMQGLYNYGRDYYTYGLPTGAMERFIVDEQVVKDYLASIETDPFVLTRVSYDRLDYPVFLQDYLVNTHGYNRYTGRITTLPTNISSTMDTDKSDYLSGLNTTVTAKLETIRGQVPVSGTTEQAVTVDGEDLTLVTETTVTSIDIVNLLPTESRYSSYVGSDLNGSGNLLDVNFDITYQSVLELRVRTLVSISHTTSVRTYYRDIANTVTNDSTVTGDPVSLLTPSETYTQSYTYGFTENYVPAFNTPDPYYYVEYHTTDSDGIITPKHLLYRDLNDNFPIFPVESVTEASPYFPVVTLRKDNADMFDSSQSDTAVYETSTALLNKLNIDVLELADSINQNPDIGDIDHAYVMFGANVLSDNKGAIRYLFEFFDRMSNLETVVKDALGEEIPDIQINIRNYENIVPITSMRIKDNGFDMEVSWTQIDVDLIQGKIGTVGTVTRDLEFVGSTSILKLVHQIDNNTYKQVRVFNPKHLNWVYIGHAVETNLQDLIDEPDDNSFIIPLHSEIVNDLPVFTRNTLYYAAPQLVLYSVTITKLKFYQTGAFKVLIVAIAIVVFIYTGFDIYSTFMTTLAAEGAVAAAIYLTSVILTSIATSYAFKYIISVIGEELGFLLTIVAIVAAIYGYTNDSAFITETWANNLLRLSANLSKGITANIQEDMSNLLRKSELFFDEADDLMDELEKKRELLDTSRLLDPFEFIRTEPLINLNESPDNFFERTVHNNNVGVIGFEAISSYVDISLQLPEPSHTF